MKNILLIFFLLLSSAVKIFAQQFSQYNTGTLYDSFENPSQRAFIPDSSKQYAFNLLIPNFNGNFTFSGDEQDWAGLALRVAVGPDFIVTKFGITLLVWQPLLSFDTSVTWKLPV